MSTGLANATATRLTDGSVLIVGGSNNGVDGTTAELFNATTGLCKSVNSA